MSTPASSAKSAPAKSQVGEAASIGFVVGTFGVVFVVYLLALFALR